MSSLSESDRSLTQAVLDENKNGSSWNLGDKKPSTNFLFTAHVSYIGRGYIGWQRQQRQVGKKCKFSKSVQEQVERAIGQAAFGSDAAHVNVHAVSRTDAGTHALWQSITFRLPKIPKCIEAFMSECNSILPSKKIRFQSLRQIPESQLRQSRTTFGKKYVYYIEQSADRPTSVGIGHHCFYSKHKFDIEALRSCLEMLVGTHDFKYFASGLPAENGKTTIRTIYGINVVLRERVEFSLDLESSGSGSVLNSSSPLPDVYYICMEFYGNGFLKHMIRRIVGSVTQISNRKLPVETILDMLNGSVAPGPSAPARGLWLHRIWQDKDEWNDALEIIKTL